MKIKSIKSMVLSLVFAFSGMSLAMQGPSLYDILGVSKDAQPEDITREYRKLALQNHPDKNPGDKAAEARMKSINEAYEILNDAQRRQKYNRYLDAENIHHTGRPFNPQAGFEGATEDAEYNLSKYKFMLSASFFGVRKGLSCLTDALTQYNTHKHLSAVKEHVALQLKNKQANKPVMRLRDALDLTWLNRLRQEGKPSPIEQTIEQFDAIVTQAPQHLPAVGTQTVKIVDIYSDAIGTYKGSLFKAVACFSASILGGYLTSDVWLPHVLNLSRFDILSFALRSLFS